MNINQIDFNEIIDKIYLSVKKHYEKSGYNVDKLINSDIKESKQCKTNNIIFRNLIYSIHNANWKAASLTTFWKKRENIYNDVFHNYDASYVSKLKLNDLINKGLIDSNRRLQSCINAAKFAVDVETLSKSDIISFFNKFAYEGSSVYERWALVNIIAQSVNGIGTALACDFLKGMGFLNYGKPDVHIKRIFKRIGILEYFQDNTVYANANFFIFRILDILAKESKKTLFEIDKTLWLFATGFNTSNGESIGGICKKDKPECRVCKINIDCNYFSAEHKTA